MAGPGTLTRIRAAHPLVHCISNIVTANDCANLALAVGASPIMAQAPEEMEEIAALGKPVLTLSHYSYAGGNRAAPLFDRFLPVAGNVRMHFYGHAHIGDEVWAGKDCHRKIAAVDGQPLMQINVASLENYRGTAVRSVIVEWYDTQEIGVLFRNHSGHCWDDYLIVREGDGIRAPQDDKNAEYD